MRSKVHSTEYQLRKHKKKSRSFNNLEDLEDSNSKAFQTTLKNNQKCTMFLWRPRSIRVFGGEDFFQLRPSASRLQSPCRILHRVGYEPQAAIG
jgi:hypothetical protein